MMFARYDLINRVKDEIARREQAAEEYNAKAVQKYEQRRQEYLDETAAAWRQFADTIRVRQRAGKPIAYEDIPRELRGGFSRGHVRTWNDEQARPDKKTADVEALKTLLDLLESATDDTVTTASLERMGFRMAQLFRTR